MIAHQATRLKKVDLMTKEKSPAEGVDTNQAEAELEAGDDVVSSAIGHRLKKLYQDVENEPVPDKFLKLLDQLSSQQPNSESD